MKKHLLSLLLALCLALSLLSVAALAASEEPAVLALDTPTADGTPAADPVSDPEPEMQEPTDGDGTEHKHTVCGGASCTCGQSHSAEEWTAWTGTDSLPMKEGYYYLTDNVTLPSDSTWPVEKNIALCLNGHTITGMNGRHTVNVHSGGTFTLTNCKSVGMITHAEGAVGSGVYVGDSGTFNMYGGKIAKNKAEFFKYYTTNDGGGVYVNENGKFTMYGGSIEDNIASTGGGVYVNDKGEFTMYGGSITGNSLRSGYGGGVRVYKGTFNMAGGSITGNAASYGGGVCITEGGSFNLSGSPKISGNKTALTGGSDSNVYLAPNHVITIPKALSNTEKIGVTSASMSADAESIVFLTGWEAHMQSKSASDHFFSEGTGYFVSAESADGKLVKKTYDISLSQTDKHTFTEAEEGYGSPTALSVTVENKGNQPTGTLTVTVSSDKFDLGMNSIESILVGNSTSFTVYPKTGLSAGPYTATVTVSGEHSISESFEVAFTVKGKTTGTGGAGTGDTSTGGTGTGDTSGTGTSELTYGYLYDVQRDPAYPEGENKSIELSGLQKPYGSSGKLDSSEGHWALSKVGTYGQLSAAASTNLASIVTNIASEYSISDKNTVVIHELKNGSDHLAYGVVVAYDATKVLFIGDTLGSGGAGYLLSTTALSGEVTMVATAVGTDVIVDNNTGNTDPKPDNDPDNSDPKLDNDPDNSEPKPSSAPTASPTAAPKASPKPVSKSPKTGDDSAVLLWAILLLGSGAAVTVCSKKSKN